MKNFVKNLVHFSLLFCAFNVATQSQERLVIHQNALEGKDLISFVSVYNSNNQQENNLKIENFRVKYGLKEGNVKSLKPFSSAQYGTSYIFMIDISKSVTKQNFQKIKDSIKSWIKTLNPGDAAAIITFGEDVRILSELSYDREKLLRIVDESVKRTDMRTKLYGGISQAHSLATFIDKRFPARKAIISLTDGVNETKDPISKENVLKLFEESSIPFYAINFAEDLNNASKKGSAEMKEISDASGGAFFDANKISIEEAYKSARRYIDKVFMLISVCDNCSFDDSIVNLQISYEDKYKTISSITKLRLIPYNEEKQFSTGERNESWKINYLFISLVFTFLVLVIIFNIVRRNRESEKSLGSHEDLDNGDEDMQVASNNPLSIRISSLSTDLDDFYSIKVLNQFTIGRSSGCDLSISDQPEISGRHCLLEIKDNNLLISDLNSRNGTFVNGVRISNKFSLKSRDIVGLGRSEYRFIYDEEEK